ncbi:MAG: hypothetical protein RIQ60_2920 [Pseudomonadota bacterium]|jgi:hypothetical protein
MRPPAGAGWVPLEPTHYLRLGLAEDASAAVVARIPPPGAQTSAELRLAHAVLSDPLRRGVYDAWLARERAALAQRVQRARGVKAARLLLVGVGVLGVALLVGGLVRDWLEPSGAQAVKTPARAAG